MNKKTAILGATTNPNRYAYLAAHRLQSYEHEIVPIGIKNGEVAGKAILNLRLKPVVQDIHTVTMYIGPSNQLEWEDYIISLNPTRIIFNPGAENDSLARKAVDNGIESIQACTLVMLSANQY